MVVGGVVVGGEVVTGVLLVCPDDRAASGREVAHADSAVHATTTAATPGATFQHLEVRHRAEVPPPVAGTIDTSPMSSEDPAARHVAPRYGAPGGFEPSTHGSGITPDWSASSEWLQGMSAGPFRPPRPTRLVGSLQLSTISFAALRFRLDGLASRPKFHGEGLSRHTSSGG